MNTHCTKTEAAHPIPAAHSRMADELKALRQHAAQAHGRTTPDPVRGTARSIGMTLGAIVTAIASWPARRAAYARLSALTDRQLTDIGLTRPDIARVFEPGFGSAKLASNDNGGRNAA